MKTVLAYLCVLAIAIGAWITAGKAIEAVGIPNYIHLDAPYTSNDGELITSASTAPGYSTFLFGLSVGVLGVMILMFRSKRTYLIEFSIAFFGLLLCWVVLAGYGWIIDRTFGYQDGYHQILSNLLWLAGVGTWGYFVFRCIRPIGQALNMLEIKGRKHPEGRKAHEDEK